MLDKGGASLRPICVAQFMLNPAKDQKPKELKEMSAYERGDFVKKQAWAKMPGMRESDGKAADECATRLAGATR